MSLNIENILSKLIIDEGVYRPDAVSIALAKSALKYGGRFLEIGTGSGFVSLVLFLRGYEGVACDISPAAVECSIKNFAVYGIKCNPFVSDLFKNVSGKYDLVLYNPPTNINENEKQRKFKNKLKKVLPELLWKPLSIIYQLINLRSRRRYLEIFIDNTKPFLNKKGVLLLSIINCDVSYFKKKTKLLKAQIINGSQNSKVFYIRFP